MSCRRVALELSPGCFLVTFGLPSGSLRIVFGSPSGHLMGRIRLWSVALKRYFFNPIKGLLWSPNLARTASAADQLVEYLSKETWHGVCGQRAAWVLVLVTRKRTASHLANYLSSSPQLQARGITSVCLKDQGSGSGEQGKDRIGSYSLFQKLIESCLWRPFKRMCSRGGTRAYLVK